jgi:hypothetical protein
VASAPVRTRSSGDRTLAQPTFAAPEATILLRDEGGLIAVVFQPEPSVEQLAGFSSKADAKRHASDIVARSRFGS